MTEIEKVGAGRAPRTPRPTAASRKAATSKTAQKAVAAGARKPADHASAKTDVQKQKEIVFNWGEDPETKKPYSYTFSQDDFDDLDYVDALIEMEQAPSDAAKSTYAYMALKALLGPEQLDLYRQRAKAANPNGRATFSDSIQFFNGLMEQLKKGNSGPSPAA